MIKRLERLKYTVNKYMADIRPDRLTSCQSEQKSVVSRRPTVLSLSDHEAEWTPFQTQLPQKNPKVCPRIEPGTSVFVVCNANH
jgi:hypothetical protein